DRARATNSAIQERERRQGLILRRRSNLFLDRQCREKPANIILHQIARMPPVVEDHVAANPMDVGLLRSWTIPQLAQPTTNDLHESKASLRIRLRRQVQVRHSLAKFHARNL